MIQIAILFMYSMYLFQAVPDTVEVRPIPDHADTVQIAPGDTLDITGTTAPEDLRREDPVVMPMQTQLNPGFEQVFSDSLQRWEQWYNLAERQQARRGSVPYRLGGHGRNDAILYRAIEPRHQLFLFDGIPINDTVTGTMNSNWLPLDRMNYYSEHTQGIRYTSEFSLKRFYVNRPLTWINFEETRNNERRAEVILTQNINRSANVELSYRGNNDDGEYRRSELSGRQASVRYTHYLNQRWTAQGMLFYNSHQMQEPGGYLIENPELFPFEPLETIPVLADANSSYRSTLLSASLYHRPDSLAPQQSRIHLYHLRNRRSYNDFEDQAFYRSFSYGIYADTRLDVGPLMLQPLVHLKGTRLDDDSNTIINRSAWSELRAGARLEINPAPFVRLSGWGLADYRTDSRTGYDIGYRFDISPFASLNLYQSLSVGEVVPTIQQLYWFSDNFLGNEELDNEQIIRAEGGIDWSYGWFSGLGVKLYGSQISSPIVIDPQTGEFINIGTYQSLGGEVYAELETNFVETGVSATLQQYMSTSDRPENQFLDQSGLRNINRAYFYLKNYFFDFATYAKIGASFTFSPDAFYSSTYYPELDYWDPLSVDAPVPSYFRLDLEASARIRTVMMLFKYENVLDEVGQAGYFETTPYPMPPRRFRIGIRWILRN